MYLPDFFLNNFQKNNVALRPLSKKRPIFDFDISSRRFKLTVTKVLPNKKKELHPRFILLRLVLVNVAVYEKRKIFGGGKILPVI